MKNAAVKLVSLRLRMGGSAGKESACNAGDLGQSLGREDPLEGNGNPFQYSYLENSMATVHGITKRRT